MVHEANNNVDKALFVCFLLYVTFTESYLPAQAMKVKAKCGRLLLKHTMLERSDKAGWMTGFKVWHVGLLLSYVDQNDG